MSNDGIVRLIGNVDIEVSDGGAYLSAWVDPTNQTDEGLDMLFSGEWDAIEVNSSLQGSLDMMIEASVYSKTGNMPESYRSKFDSIRADLAAMIKKIESLTYEPDQPDTGAPDQT